MKKHIIEQGKADLISTGGNHLIGRIFQSTNPKSFLKDFQKRRDGSISDFDIIASMIGIMANGKSDFNDIDLYQDDVVFQNAFGIKQMPAESTFRNRFDELPEKFEKQIRELNDKYLKDREFGTVKDGISEYIPVDLDVSPFDNSGSSKLGVSRTYKQHDGFAPMFAYIGSEGYLLDCELRPGKQHCQSGTPEFLKNCIAKLKKLGILEKCLIRLDGGNDASENIEILKESGVRFLVKRNGRKESPEQLLAVAKRTVEEYSPRFGKQVYYGTLEHKMPKDFTEPVTMVYEVTVRTHDHEGNPYCLEMVDVASWWTNLYSDPNSCVNLYHDHGTSEQFHSELKSDLDFERLPSGKLGVNKKVLLCGMVAYNCLRILGQAVIERKDDAPVLIKVKRWRMKTILQNIVYSAVRIIRTAGRIKVSFGKYNPWYHIMESIDRAYA